MSDGSGTLSTEEQTTFPKGWSDWLVLARGVRVRRFQSTRWNVSARILLRWLASRVLFCVRTTQMQSHYRISTDVLVSSLGPSTHFSRPLVKAHVKCLKVGVRGLPSAHHCAGPMQWKRFMSDMFFAPQTICWVFEGSCSQRGYRVSRKLSMSTMVLSKGKI